MKDKTDKSTVDAFSSNWGGVRPGAGRRKTAEPSKVIRVPLSKLAAVQAILDVPADDCGALDFNYDSDGWQAGEDDWGANVSARVSASADWVQVVVSKRLARSAVASKLIDTEALAALDFVLALSAPQNIGLALDTWNRVFGARSE